MPQAFGLDPAALGGCAAGGRIFLAGDMRTGTSLVVTAIADGRRAAKLADSYLMSAEE